MFSFVSASDTIQSSNQNSIRPSTVIPCWVVQNAAPALTRQGPPVPGWLAQNPEDIFTTQNSEYLLNFRIDSFRSSDHLGSFRMVHHEFLHLMSSGVCASHAQNLLLFPPLMPSLAA